MPHNVYISLNKNNSLSVDTYAPNNASPTDVGNGATWQWRISPMLRQNQIDSLLQAVRPYIDIIIANTEILRTREALIETRMIQGAEALVYRSILLIEEYCENTLEDYSYDIEPCSNPECECCLDVWG
jgi:hypothetical protein